MKRGLSRQRKGKRKNKLLEGIFEEKVTYHKPTDEIWCYCIPQWAQEILQTVKENSPEIYDAINENEEDSLDFKKKDDVRTVIALGTEKLLQWLKEYSALSQLEGNISIRDYLSKFDSALEDYESKSIVVTFEEKDQLMELILRQSELLMMYHLFLKYGCRELKGAKLKQRTTLPELEGASLKKGKQKPVEKYDLPRWAVDVLSLVMKEKSIETKDEEAITFLMPILKLPRHLRKEDACRRLEKGKKKMLKYLETMKHVQSADIVLPNADAPVEKTAEAMKTMILNNRNKAVKQQFLKLFSDLGSNLPSGGNQEPFANYTTYENIEETIHRHEDEKRLEEKLELEENILKMDKKLRACKNFLKTTEEITCVNENLPLPKFEVPNGRTDMNPGYYAIVEGRPVNKSRFNKAEYLETMKRTFMNTLVSKLTEDRNSQIEQKNLREIDYLLKILDYIDYYTEAFTIYLFENQEESMVSTRSFLDFGQLVMAKEAEIVQSQKILSVLKSALYSLGGLLKFRRLCQTILHELAPYTWRDKYLKEKEKYQEDADEAADQILAHLAMFKSNALIQQPALDNLVIFLADTVRNLGPPASYFTHSFQIDLAIRNLELENLYSFQHLALLIKKREEQERAKNELIDSCRCEIKKMEMLVEKLRDQLHSKVKKIKETDQRSQIIVDMYWRVVVTNEPLMEAITLINSLYDEFIGQNVKPTSNPLEMLDLLTEDIVTTQMELSELPEKATKNIRAFICEKESLQKEVQDKEKRDFERMEKLLKTMKTSWGLNVAQQGHPLRYRSCPPGDQQYTSGDFNEENPRTPVSQKIIRRIKHLFEPTCQDDALFDTLTFMVNTNGSRKSNWLAVEDSDCEEDSI